MMVDFSRLLPTILNTNVRRSKKKNAHTKLPSFNVICLQLPLKMASRSSSHQQIHLLCRKCMCTSRMYVQVYEKSAKKKAGKEKQRSSVFSINFMIQHYDGNFVHIFHVQASKTLGPSCKYTNEIMPYQMMCAHFSVDCIAYSVFLHFVLILFHSIRTMANIKIFSLEI